MYRFSFVSYCEKCLSKARELSLKTRTDYPITQCQTRSQLYKVPYLYNREIKHHVYVKRQTRICTRWPSFSFTCRLLFIISSHKLVASRNFLSIRIVLSCFTCSFSILRNSQLKSDVFRLPYTWSLNSLIRTFARERQ